MRQGEKTSANVKERYIHNDRLNVYSVALPHHKHTHISHRTLGAINDHSINSHMHESAVHIVPQKSFQTHSYTVYNVQINSRHSRLPFTVSFCVHKLYLTSECASVLKSKIGQIYDGSKDMKRTSLFYLFILKNVADW